MRASLAADIDAFSPGGGYKFHAATATHMYDVQTAAAIGRTIDRLLDCFQFCFNWS